jgi:hypothetical protein
MKLTEAEINTICTKLDYLASRWSDESEYENFNDYIEAIKKVIPARAEFKKLINRPFSLGVKLNETKYVFTVKGRSITVKTIN